MVDNEVGDALLLDSIVEAGEEGEDEVVVADEGVPAGRRGERDDKRGEQACVMAVWASTK